MSNYGDDLFALTSLAAARKYWPGFEAHIWGPRDYRLGPSVSASGVFRKETLRNRTLAGKLARGANLAVASAVSDRLVFAGGSIFHSGRVSTASQLLKSRRAFRLSDFAAIGVSVGPFASEADRREVRRQLSALSFLAVRDRQSMRAVEELGIGVPTVEAADLAGVYADCVPVSGSAPEAGLTIGFAPCFDGSGRGLDTRLCRAFVDALGQVERAAGRRPRVRIFCLNTNPLVGDAELCSETARALGEKGYAHDLVTYDEVGVEETWKRIGAVDFLVSGRLHGAVTAYMQGVAFLLHEYHRKCSDWLTDIDGRDDAGIATADLSAERIAERIVGSFARRRPLLPVGEYTARARLNFTAAPWSG